MLLSNLHNITSNSVALERGLFHLTFFCELMRHKGYKFLKGNIQTVLGMSIV